MPASVRPPRPIATVIATLPPPTTGMTSVTLRMVAALEKRGPVHLVNLSHGGASRRRGWRAVRSLRQLGAAARVLTGTLGAGSIYIALNSGIAVALDLTLVAASRARGRTIYLHHHSFRYLDAPNPLLTALYRLGGEAVVDITLCPGMADALHRHYGRRNARVVPNLVELPPNAPLAPGTGPIKIGHLANLTIPKGIARVVDAFAEVRADGLDAELHIAGPCTTAEAQAAVDCALATWPDRVLYHGPRYGNDKDAFYTNLDLFLYPTAYVVEAQPLVLLEALGAGVPVISVDRGCIAGLADIDAVGSVTIAPLDQFGATVTHTVRTIGAFTPTERADRRIRARAAAASFAIAASSAFDTIADEIATGSGARLRPHPDMNPGAICAPGAPTQTVARRSA